MLFYITICYEFFDVVCEWCASGDSDCIRNNRVQSCSKNYAPSAAVHAGLTTDSELDKQWKLPLLGIRVRFMIYIVIVRAIGGKHKIK